MNSEKLSPAIKLMLICKAIRDAGRPLGQAEIAAASRIDRATVSRIVGDLHERHWLQEIDGKFVLGDAVTSFWVAGLYAIHANLHKLTPKPIQNHIHPTEEISEISPRVQEKTNAQEDSMA